MGQPYILNHFLEGRIHLGSFILICPGALTLHSQHWERVFFMDRGQRAKGCFQKSSSAVLGWSFDICPRCWTRVAW